ncbi:Hypothetical predicted protein [Cloeon dipterum]|uniref:Uncharacterized protein n=1 Tax=Cloeon dipterum TaxID=197152 RepID=A0A8S1E992_9INSE|nr:Hypothetical predicted protein [Cloeon dipterum]
MRCDRDAGKSQDKPDPADYKHSVGAKQKPSSNKRRVVSQKRARTTSIEISRPVQSTPSRPDLIKGLGEFLNFDTNRTVYDGTVGTVGVQCSSGGEVFSSACTKAPVERLPIRPTVNAEGEFPCVTFTHLDVDFGVLYHLVDDVEAAQAQASSEQQTDCGAEQQVVWDCLPDLSDAV